MAAICQFAQFHGYKNEKSVIDEPNRIHVEMNFFFFKKKRSLLFVNIIKTMSFFGEFAFKEGHLIC